MCVLKTGFHGNPPEMTEKLHENSISPEICMFVTERCKTPGPSRAGQKGVIIAEQMLNISEDAGMRDRPGHRRS
jgi:hypothetical protein